LAIVSSFCVFTYCDLFAYCGEKQQLVSILPAIFRANIAFDGLGYKRAPLQQFNI